MRAFAYAVTLLVLGIAIAGAFIAGREAGEQGIVSDILKDRAESVEEKREIDNEVEGLDRDSLLDRALEFVRP